MVRTLVGTPDPDPDPEQGNDAAAGRDPFLALCDKLLAEGARGRARDRAMIEAITERHRVAAEEPDSELGAVARAAITMAEALSERNRAIRAAVAAGHSHRAVARAAGLTHPAIAKIVNPAPRDDTPR